MYTRRRGPKLKTSVVRALDLPPDVALDLPRLTLVGGLHLELENHRGLVRYSPSEVTVAFRGGELDVRGADLVVDRLDDRAVILSGRVREITVSDYEAGDVDS